MRGHREVRHQVLGVVPHEGGDPLVAGDPELVAQRVREPGGLAPDLGVRHPAGLRRRSR